MSRTRIVREHGPHEKRRRACDGPIDLEPHVPVECDACGKRGVKVPRSRAAICVLCEDCAAHAAAEIDL